MQTHERPTLARRSFLSGLSALPLIGGSVAVIGQPTAAAVPVTNELRWAYKEWLHADQLTHVVFLKDAFGQDILD